MNWRTAFLVSALLCASSSVANAQFGARGFPLAQNWNPQARMQLAFRSSELYSDGFGVRRVSGTFYTMPNIHEIRFSVPGTRCSHSRAGILCAPQSRPERPRKEQSLHPAPDMPSTALEIARSVRKQEQGDAALKKKEYKSALASYRAADHIASDRAETKFRLGLVLAATGEYDEAVELFNDGLELDRDWPKRSFTLDEMFGTDDLTVKATMQTRVAEWCRHDVRDPDRLCLMGLLLHLDRNPKAEVFFETAHQLAGDTKIASAFRSAYGSGAKSEKTASPSTAKSPASSLASK